MEVWIQEHSIISHQELMLRMDAIGTGGLGDDALGWPWQECSEIIMAMCASGGANDVFWSECGDNIYDTLKQGCVSIFGSMKWTTANWNIDAVKTLYGYDLSGSSNLILTQGHLDPWSGGGYKVDQTNTARGIYVMEIPGSAHHLDLRQPNTCDPNTVVNARYQIVQILKCWVDVNCNTIPTISPLPTLSIPNVECKDRIGEYPWGQTDKAAATHLVALGEAADGTTSGAAVQTSSVAPDAKTTANAPIATSSAAPEVKTPSAAPDVKTTVVIPIATSSIAPAIQTSSAATAVKTSSAAPVATSSSAPEVKTSSVVPDVQTSSAAPIATSSNAPDVHTSSVAPIATSSAAPVATSSSAPEVKTSSVVPDVQTSSAAPIATSSNAPDVHTSSVAPIATSSAAPVATSSAAPDVKTTVVIPIATSSIAPAVHSSSAAPAAQTSSAAPAHQTSSVAPVIHSSSSAPIAGSSSLSSEPQSSTASIPSNSTSSESTPSSILPPSTTSTLPSTTTSSGFSNFSFFSTILVLCLIF
ncbi:Protein CBG23655 [Caenorhabditis briggsae]|uniref:Protein CBG23655 n=1 Tax=Caenorhabditis briggsae TaxID=6238 RepID=A8WJ12_CAEBR|nr:Protein CBG23655 [Caenorhabditis briggsae]CAP20456.1 Protein CBG23655 [Caenorhabditis briggsae]